MKNLLSLFLAIALLCCGGCSAIRLSYDHADLYLRYKIHGYTSFNSQQKDEIRQKVDEYMNWHRKNALPEYIAFLQEVYGLARRSDRLKTEEVALLRDEYNRLYRKTLEPAIRPTAHMLNALDSSQIEGLVKALAKKIQIQKEEKLIGSDQKNLVMRAKRNIDFVEKLVDSLSGEQEDKIIELSLHMPYAAIYYIEFREANQDKLIELLKSKAGEDKIAAFLWSWINTPEETRTPQQQQAIQSYEHTMDEMTVGIYELLTDSQKIELREKILSYIEDFQHLKAEK
jgi:hypothetical protein